MSTRKFFGVIVLAGAVLSGCGGGGGSTATGPTVNVNPASCSKSVTSGFNGPFDLRGGLTGGGGGPGGVGGGGVGGGVGVGASAGLVRAGLVEVKRLDGSLVGTAQTDSTTGMVTMVLCEESGPLLIEIKGQPGATYYDEVLDRFTDFGPGNRMRAIVDQVRGNIGVTPLTEAAVQRLEQAGSNFTGGANAPSTAQIAAANDLIQSRINEQLPPEIRVESITALPWVASPDPSAEAVPDNPRGVHGLVVSGLIRSSANFGAATSSSAPALQVARQIAADLADGVLDRQQSTASGAAPVSSADQAAYSVDQFASSVPAAAGLIAQRFGSDAVRRRVFVVARVFWETVPPLSDDTTLPLTGDGTRFVWIELMSDGALRIVHPVTGAQIAREAGARFTDLSSAGQTATAVSDDGRIFGLGANNGGQLGLGTTDSVAVWRELTNPDWVPAKVTQVWNASQATFARLSDGRMYGWGTGAALPNRSAPTLRELRPQQCEGIDDAVSVAANGPTVFAIRPDGSLLSWGGNAPGDGFPVQGRLGTGDDETTYSGTPTQVLGLTNVVAVAPGPKAIFALRGDGTVWAWGNNFIVRPNRGATLGDPTFTGSFRSTPGRVAGLTDVIGISTSGGTGFALKRDGTLMYWGSLPCGGTPSASCDVTNPTNLNIDPQPRLHQAEPIPVPGFEGIKFIRLTKVSSSGSIALTSDGRVVPLYGTN